jgi:hypothetical protein
MNWALDLLTRLGATSNYNAIGDLRTLQITTATAKPLPAFCVLKIRSLARATNSGEFSASDAHVVPSRTLIQFFLSALPSNELVRHLFSASLAALNCIQH